MDTIQKNDRLPNTDQKNTILLPPVQGRWDYLWDLATPPNARQDPRLVNRYRGVSKVLWSIGGLIAGLWAIFQWIIPSTHYPPLFQQILAVSLLIPIISLILIRCSKNTTMGIMFASIIGAPILILMSLVTGGIQSFVSPWFIVFIAIMANLGNKYLLILTTNIALGSIVLIYIATLREWDVWGGLLLNPLTPNYMPHEYPILIFVSIFSGILLIAISNTSTYIERVNSKRLLRIALDEAMQASLARSTFLSSASHELMTPLTAIIGFAEILKDDSNLDKSSRSHALHILHSGEHLHRLLSQVMEISRADIGSLPVNLKSVSIRSNLDEAWEMVELSADRRGIKIHIPDSKAIDVSLWADPLRLQQILINLLSNAVKYNRENGIITITGQIDQHHSTFRLNIADQGTGIPLGRQKELFQLFSRLDAAHRNIPGSGLGLVIAERLIKLMGGRIGVETAESGGSIFWIELPFPSTSHDFSEQNTVIAIQSIMNEQENDFSIESKPKNP